ncbi:MAG TPA: DUF4242 domain-containing protein [Lacunisphaera sp.]
MKSFLFLCLIALALPFAGCAGPSKTAAAPSYFIDVHEFGPGKVTAAAVAEAHLKDLAVQDKHGVRFLEYWVDEEHGRVYCLSAAKDAPSITAAHREAHGLLPASILPVTSGVAVPSAPGKQLFVDVHELGAGNVTAQAVAEAHKKDLAVEGEFGVRFLNYWVDEVNGKVLCLSEAPSADAVRETHRKAHGLLPNAIEPVTAGK